MIVDGNGLSAADVAAVTGGFGNGNGGFGNGWGGDGAWWLLVLFLFAANGNGFGNGWGGGGNGGGCNGTDMNYFFNTQTQNDVNRGFADLTTQNAVSALQQAVNNGFSDQAVSQCNQTTTLMQGQNAIQNSILTGLATLGNQACNDKFDTISTLNNGHNAILMQMANNEAAREKCCCDAQLQTVQQTTALLQDGALTRQTINDGVQSIKDQMCQDKIDAKNERIVQLENQLNLANLAASQIQQTGQILADNAAQTAALEQYLNPPARPAYLVQNPNTAYNPFFNNGWNNGWGDNCGRCCN